jgi:hypothetical protein
MMLRKLTTLTAAAALAISGLTAIPAQAKNKDLGKVLAGAAALFIIAKAIEADKKSRAEVKRQRQEDAWYDYEAAERAALEQRLAEERARNGITAPADLVIPGTCAFDINGAYGAETVAGADCLNLNYAYASSLPATCSKSIETRNGLRLVYDLDCLERAGFPVEARR